MKLCDFGESVTINELIDLVSDSVVCVQIEYVDPQMDIVGSPIYMV